jgi:hypothetical protein
MPNKLQVRICYIQNCVVLYDIPDVYTQNPHPYGGLKLHMNLVCAYYYYYCNYYKDRLCSLAVRVPG